MNKIIFMICALYMMLCMSCTPSTQVNYTIKGTVNSINEKTAYLYTAEGDRFIIDSTTVNDNSFRFKGTQPKQCFASISIGKNNRGIILILENGIINAIINKQGTKIIGTPTNDILNDCNEKINAFNDEFYALRKQASELKENQKDELAVLQKKWEKLSEKQIAVVKKCLNNNLNNIIGSYLLHKYESILSNEEFAKILSNASPAMKDHIYTKEAIEHHEALMHTEVGQKFTDFKMKDPNDKEVALSDYVGKGKYVLIEFWASWCGPCRGEMPNVKAAYEKFKSKGFEIVGVSLDDKKEDWIKVIEEFGITWPQMSDLKGWKSKSAKLYGIRGIPSTFLIDPNGIIIAKGLRGEEIEKKLSELLN